MNQIYQDLATSCVGFVLCDPSNCMVARRSQFFAFSLYMTDKLTIADRATPQSVWDWPYSQRVSLNRVVQACLNYTIKATVMICPCS